MKIVCPCCAATCEIVAAESATVGQAIRCKRCNNEWQAFESPGPLPEGQTVPANSFGPQIEIHPPFERARQQREDRASAEKPRQHPSLRLSAGRFAGPMALGLVAIAICVLVAGRQAIVSTLPATAQLYGLVGLEVNVRGLAFRDLKTSRVAEHGKTVLIVESRIENISTSVKALPSVRMSLHDNGRQEIYSWTVDPQADVLKSGASWQLRTRLTAPPDQATEIKLRFVKRRHQTAGLKK